MGSFRIKQIDVWHFPNNLFLQNNGHDLGYSIRMKGTISTSRIGKCFLFALDMKEEAHNPIYCCCTIRSLLRTLRGRASEGQNKENDKIVRVAEINQIRALIVLVLKPVHT